MLHDCTLMEKKKLKKKKKIQSCRYLRDATGERTYLPKMTRIFPAKIVRN